MRYAVWQINILNQSRQTPARGPAPASGPGFGNDLEIRPAAGCGLSDSTGVRSEHFQALLEFYLRSAVMDFNGQFYVQKAFICIGLSFCPVLCNIFLASMNRRISECLIGMYVVRIFRYWM